MAEDAEINGNGNGDNDNTVKRSPFFNKPNVSIKYFTSLRSKKKWVSFDSFWPLLKLLVESTIKKAIK